MTIITPNGEKLRPSTRVLVFVSAGATMPTTAAWSLASLLAATSATRPDVEVNLIVDRDPIAAQARQSAVLAGIQANYTHILFLSPDVVVPRDTISRLLKLDAHVAAAAVMANEIPSYPLAVDLLDEPLYVAEDAEGVRAVSQVTLHCALVDLRTFGSLPRRPWFMPGYSQKTGQYQSDELYFIQQVREQGHSVLVDLALSREVTHIGEMEYRSVHALQSRDLARPDEAPAGGN